MPTRRRSETGEERRQRLQTAERFLSLVPDRIVEGNEDDSDDSDEEEEPSESPSLRQHTMMHFSCVFCGLNFEAEAETAPQTETGEVICPRCVDRTEPCAWCTHPTLLRNALNIRNNEGEGIGGGIICRDCRHAGAWCAGCERFYPNSELDQIQVDSDDYSLYCLRCRMDVQREADAEARRLAELRSGNLYFTSDDAYGASAILNNRGEMPNYFRSHAGNDYLKTRIRSKNYAEMPYARFFGIEFEIAEADSGWIEKLKGTTGYGISHDGSVNKQGLELQSRIMQGDTGLRHLENACGIMLRANAKVDRSCGMHIHMDATDISENDLVKIYVLYYQAQKYLYSMLPQSRRDNHFCYEITPDELDRVIEMGPAQHLYGGDIDMEKLDEKIMKREYELCMKKEKKDNAWRYCFFNLHAYYYLSTIEIRNHSGTTDYEKVKNWAIINLALVEAGKAHDMDWACEKMSTERFLSIMPNESVRKYIQERWKKFGMVRKMQPEAKAVIETKNFSWRDAMSMFEEIDDDARKNGKLPSMRKKTRKRKIEKEKLPSAENRH